MAKRRSECRCSCHDKGGVIHMFPCCEGDNYPEFYSKQVFELLEILKEEREDETPDTIK